MVTALQLDDAAFELTKRALLLQTEYKVALNIDQIALAMHILKCSKQHKKWWTMDEEIRVESPVSW